MFKSLKLGLLTTVLSTSALAADVTVLAGEQGTSSTGWWRYASGASMPVEGNRGMYTTQGSEATYTFEFTAPETADYELEVFNTCYNPRGSNVNHTITTNAGDSVHVLDQHCATDPYVGQWRPLETVALIEGEVVTLVIDETGSNNSYVGAGGFRGVYTSSGTTDPVDPEPTDPEPTDPVDPEPTDPTPTDPPSEVTVEYAFNCEVNSLGLTAYNSAAVPVVGKRCGKYYAEITDNTSSRTLFYHGWQGRLDGVTVKYPATATLYNVGVGTLDNPEGVYSVSGQAYMFAGLQVHHVDFNNINSAHMVVGQRGNRGLVVEGKHTLNGDSEVDDTGPNSLPGGRADIRLELDAQGLITAYWKVAGATDWQLYNGTGNFPGPAPDLGDSGEVVIGIITYAQGSTGLPFVGVADRLVITSQE